MRIEVDHTVNTELYHYGVKGMKWGVRRYQDEKGRLTRAGKQRAKDQRINKKIEKYIKSGKARVENLSHYEVGELNTMLGSKGEQYVSALSSGHDFEWRETNRVGDWEFTPSSHIKNMLDEFGTNPYGLFDSETIVQHKLGRLTDGDLERCNPGFGQAGTTQNCTKCAAGLELRLRGYSVEAGRQTYPASSDAHSLWFEGAKRVDYDYDVAEKALTSYGPKTSGTLGFSYPNSNSGHAVHWTVDAKGKFEIQDGQNGRRFGSLSEMIDSYGGDKTGSITTFRLDNCKPNFDAMDRDSVIRGDYLRNENTGQTAWNWHDTQLPPPIPDYR